MSITNQLMQQGPPGLQQWREERAYRAGMAMTWVLFVICCVAAVLNIVYASLLEFLADLVLIAGCIGSFILTKRQAPRRLFVWWPIYPCFFVAILPSMFNTGGVYSPWIGTYLAGLAILGTVMQVRINPLYNTLVILIYIAAWTVYQHFIPITEITTYPPVFMGVTTALAMSGIGVGLYSIIKTERILCEQFEQQYKELYETREHLTREENANQAKTDFLANVSHELRTPLGAMLGYAQLLQEERVSTEDKVIFAAAIERNGHQLTRLVDDLLDLSKVEAGSIELEQIDFNIRELIEEVMDLFLVNAKEKGIQLATYVASHVPEVLNADPYRLKQILTNLVSNALKFTSKGYVRVDVDCRGQAPCELVIKVKDSGRGIAQEERKKIFKRFSQADTSTTRRYGGTGLGLNFSQQLAELYKGSLELTWSEPNVGSEFTLKIQTNRPQNELFGTKNGAERPV